MLTGDLQNKPYDTKWLDIPKSRVNLDTELTNEIVSVLFVANYSRDY